MNISTTAYRSSTRVLTRQIAAPHRRQAATTAVSTSVCSSSKVMTTVTSASTSTLFPEEIQTTTSKRQHNTLRTRTSSSLQRTGGEIWNEMTDQIEPPTITSRSRDIEVLQQSLRKLGLLNEMILKPGL